MVYIIRNAVITLRDVNAKIEKGKVANVLGYFGLGKIGDRLMEFMNNMEWLIWFKQHPRKVYTWTASQRTNQKIVQNQKVFILITQRFRNSVKCTGADINSHSI